MTTIPDAVPWPWPLAPLFLGLLLGAAGLVLALLNKYVIRGEE